MIASGARATAVAAALLAGGAVAAQTRTPAAAPPADQRAARIAFVPLDDRPRSLADIARLAEVADAELFTPPTAIVGRHFKTGDGDGIAEWLDRLDVSRVDAAVVSIDMLAFGGLIGSRTGRVLEPDARRRVEALARLKARRPRLPVFVFASLTRLAPNHDGSNPGWNAALTRWAEIAPAAARDAAAAAALAEVEAKLPAGMLDRYRAVRARNVAVTLQVIEQLDRGAIDFLVIGEDEAGEAGVHVGERQQLQAAVGKTRHADRVAFRRGVVDVAPLLLARALAGGGRAPQTVAVRYSSTEVEQAHAPGVEAALRVAGLRLEAGRTGHLVLEVFRSGDRAPAEVLAKRVVASSARRTAVADVGEVGGGSALGLLEVLRSHKALRLLAGFAAGPEPDAAISAALAHAVAFDRGVAAVAAGPAGRGPRVAAAHLHLLLRRAIVDVLLGDVVAPQAVDEVLTPRKLDANALGDRERAQLEEYVHDELGPLAQSLASDFGGAGGWRLPGKAGAGGALVVKDLAGLKVELPWSRLDEPDVTFTLEADTAGATPRPPGPRIVR